LATVGGPDTVVTLACGALRIGGGGGVDVTAVVGGAGALGVVSAVGGDSSGSASCASACGAKLVIQMTGMSARNKASQRTKGIDFLLA